MGTSIVVKHAASILYHKMEEQVPLKCWSLPMGPQLTRRVVVDVRLC